MEKAIDFFEELLWFLDSKKNLKLKGIPKGLRDLLAQDTHGLTSKYINNFAVPNSNIRFLIGVLPQLFQDEKLFATNIQIAKFAEEVLGINVTRPDKRSKYELIGLIVCQTNNLSDSQLVDLVQALNELTQSVDKLNLVRNIVQNDSFSWNETIQKLTER